MVIIRLAGGLGNQMFQYAAALQLAQRLGTTVKLDIFTCMNNKINGGVYSLWKFNVNEELATPGEIAKARAGRNYYEIMNFFLGIKAKLILRYFKGSYGNMTLGEFLRLLLNFVIPKAEYEYIIQDIYKEFDDRIINCSNKKNIYVQGFYQSEKYFPEVTDILLKKFTLNGEFSGCYNSTLEKIQSSNSIAVHIRRGDIIKMKDRLDIHGVCSLDYYKLAIEYFINKVEQSHFYIFSDDSHNFLDELLTDYKYTIVNNNSKFAEFEDLSLMSKCKHQIIANSSFSWWAAWLNTNPDKTVIAPKDWFASRDFPFTSIIPDGWYTI